jgi:hypothetical protein
MIGTKETQVSRSIVGPIPVNMVQVKRNRAGVRIHFAPTANMASLALRLFYVTANVVRYFNGAFSATFPASQPFCNVNLKLMLMLTSRTTVLIRWPTDEIHTFRSVAFRS